MRKYDTPWVAILFGIVGLAMSIIWLSATQPERMIIPTLILGAVSVFTLILIKEMP